MSQLVVPAPKSLLSVSVSKDFESILETWVAGRSPDTVRAYLKGIALFCDFVGCECVQLTEFLSKLTPAEGNLLFLRYTKSLKETKYASNTILTRLTALRSFFSLCRTAGLMTWDIEIKPQVEQVKYRDTRGPGAKAIDKIINSIKGNDRISRRDRAILWLLYSPALRRKEVSKLNMSSVDLDDQRLLVWQKKKRDPVPVTLPAPAVEAMYAWLEVRPQCGKCGADDPLFISLDPRHFGLNVRFSGGSIWKMVVKRSTGVGIRTSPHRMRHTGITRALDLTHGNIREVAKFSRHADYRTVAIYDDNRRNVQGKIASMVAGGKGKKRA